MEDLFLKTIDMSITGCYVVLAVLLVRLLLKQAPKKYSYALWAVVGFRLVCPVSFQSVVSLFNLSPFTTNSGAELTYIPQNIGLAATLQISTGPAVTG